MANINARIFWVLIVAFAWPSRANEFIRPRNGDELSFLSPGTTTDEFVRVPDATVAWMNRAALERDFPALVGKSDDEIRHWILDNFAYVSRGQLELQGIRMSSLAHDVSQTRTGFRPQLWNRAAVLEARGSDGHVQGMVDIKGIGQPTGGKGIASNKADFAAAKAAGKVDEFLIKDHSDGLMSFGEGVAEVSRQTAEQRLYDLRNAKVPLSHGGQQTVESYFIVSLPTEILKNQGAKIPAALYGRQAHWGRQSGLTIPDALAIDPFGKVQATAFRTRVDFGGVMIMDTRLRANFGPMQGSEMIDAQKTKPWAWGHQASEAYLRGDREAVTRHIREMLAPINDEWEKVPHGQTMPTGIATLVKYLRRVESTEPLTVEELNEFDAPYVFAKDLVALRASPQKLREIAKLSPLLRQTWGPALLKASKVRGVPLGSALFTLLRGWDPSGVSAQTVAKIAGVPESKLPVSVSAFVNSLSNPGHLPLAEFENSLRESFARMGYPSAEIPDPKDFLFIEGRLKASDAFDAAHIEASMGDLELALKNPVFPKFNLTGILRQHADAIRQHGLSVPNECVAGALAPLLGF